MAPTFFSLIISTTRPCSRICLTLRAFRSFRTFSRPLSTSDFISTLLRLSSFSGLMRTSSHFSFGGGDFFLGFILAITGAHGACVRMAAACAYVGASGCGLLTFLTFSFRILFSTKALWRRASIDVLQNKLDDQSIYFVRFFKQKFFHFSPFCSNGFQAAVARHIVRFCIRSIKMFQLIRFRSSFLLRRLVRSRQADRASLALSLRVRTTFGSVSFVISLSSSSVSTIAFFLVLPCFLFVFDFVSIIGPMSMAGMKFDPKKAEPPLFEQG